MNLAAAPVDIALMMRNLAELARWTKLSGTAEEAESLRYVEKQMASYGYATRVLTHPAFISLPGPARVVAGGVTLRAITHSMSASSPATGTTGPLIYLGQGTDADFGSRNLRGAIVLVEGIASPAVALRASRAGAAGQLHISPHEHLHEMCISPVWGSPDTTEIANLPTTVALTIDARDGRALRDRLSAGRGIDITLHAEVDTGWRQTPILVADMAAPDADDDTPFVLFSGHHDTWYKGVMDNGAANVTMMEVARLCASQRALWRRSLRFCFWSGHSHGRYSSSSWYADTHWRELERRCAVHVNVDSTGGIGAASLDEASAATELAGLADDVLRAEAGRPFSGKRLGRNSDQSFWGIGIPSIFSILSTQSENNPNLRNNLGWWWHTPDDLIDKIDPALLERDTRIYRHVLSRLLTDRVLPIDPTPQVQDLYENILRLGIEDSQGIPVSALAAELLQLKEICRHIVGQDMPSDEDARAIDRLLMRLSRSLVPVDYTAGNRFAHDPALPQPGWPSLEPLRRFASEPAKSAAWHSLQVQARRALNTVSAAIGQALRDIARYRAS